VFRRRAVKFKVWGPPWVLAFERFAGLAALRRRFGEWASEASFVPVLLGACLATASWVCAAELQNLEIVSKSGVHVFSVEVATTDEERERGLMFRKELPDGRGMLFDFETEHSVAMWMKNTLIPLDMIFIRADGRISNIAESTEPMSTRIIPSRGAVRAVLEVAGGTAKRLGIEVGDRVAHPMFRGS
jgi:uncharacterized membrane protein (UPF0127 family)